MPKRWSKPGLFCYLRRHSKGAWQRISGEVRIPTIGIGAGNSCDGQVLVVNDLLGLRAESEKKLPKFVKQYADLRKDILSAVKEFRSEVRDGTFPDDSNSY